MNDTELILIRVLAEYGALTVPAESLSRRGGGRRWFASEHVAENGIRWHSYEPTSAGRKAAQRGLERLARDGLVIVHHPYGGRIVFARLTTAGKAKARAILKRRVAKAEYLARVDLALGSYDAVRSR